MRGLSKTRTTLSLLLGMVTCADLSHPLPAMSQTGEPPVNALVSVIWVQWTGKGPAWLTSPHSPDLQNAMNRQWSSPQDILSLIRKECPDSEVSLKLFVSVLMECGKKGNYGSLTKLPLGNELDLNVGTKVELTPKYANGKIALAFNVDVSEVDGYTKGPENKAESIPTIIHSQGNTSCLLGSGETIIFGGLIRKAKDRNGKDVDTSSSILVRAQIVD